ncbi:MAG: bifunctional diaminohydroxyphosphoribosylaminopyrimidine deaminase/5-amino-6-(5-phosphoribosylamino)uracil reductase RibD [Nitrospirae bacterium]|nr:bifunctional diaminohydroxyphosphoribosylaminopyrimidine deaminase/5-amino-6-(5-phosphoribosylamino)uracil reductase RibD [Nitrospirota bacterium]
MSDEVFMRRALRLAARGRGWTSPNPMVGAVVVHDGRIIGEGYHRGPGTPHAEIHALRAAGSAAHGAVLYVTLEPCCHRFKRTPPCTDAVIASGVKRVVVAMPDPNPRVRGRGLRALRRAGLAVEVGVLAETARRLNEAYVVWITTGRPFVTLKIASTLDGKIATASGESRWITGPRSRALTHRLRAQVDAVMVGLGTVIADDPELTARSGLRGRQPHRIILDERLGTPLRARVLRPRDGSWTYVATTARAPAARRRRFEALGVKVLVAKSRKGLVDMADVMRRLGRLEMTSVLIEGGAAVNASALRSGVVRKVIVMVAPKLLGGHDAVGSVGGESPRRLRDAVSLRGRVVRRCGDDIVVEGYL